MRTVYLFLLIILCSCERQRKDQLDDIVETKPDGTQEVKVEQLTLEDIARLEAAAGEQGESYQGVLNNEMERIFWRKADTNETILWKLDASQKNAKLYVYKETYHTVKKDSNTVIKVKEYQLVCDAVDSCTQSSEKRANYKMVVKLNPKFMTDDSICDFTLKVIKK